MSLRWPLVLVVHWHSVDVARGHHFTGSRLRLILYRMDDMPRVKVLGMPRLPRMGDVLLWLRRVCLVVEMVRRLNMNGMVLLMGLALVLLGRPARSVVHRLYP